MKELNLTNQENIRNAVQPYVVAMWNELLKRKDIWGTLSIEKRQQIIEEEHDVMIDLAWDIFKKLYKNFFNEKTLPLKELL